MIVTSVKYGSGNFSNMSLRRWEWPGP